MKFLSLISTEQEQRLRNTSFNKFNIREIRKMSSIQKCWILLLRKWAYECPGTVNEDFQRKRGVSLIKNWWKNSPFKRHIHSIKLKLKDTQPYWMQISYKFLNIKTIFAILEIIMSRIWSKQFTTKNRFIFLTEVSF